jgi:holo-[acyl-carrier protein] synthase
MIVGVGLDLCLISRMERALSRSDGRFAARVFTDGERKYCDGKANPGQHYAARFAAKEAILKALHVPDGLSWHELEVIQGSHGGPAIALHGAARQAAEQLGVSRLHISLTHQGDSASAVVIAER